MILDLMLLGREIVILDTIYAYFHAGSKNHGCEAIVRSTKKLLKKKIILISDASEEDKIYHLDELVDVKNKRRTRYSIIEKILTAFTVKVMKSEKYSYNLITKHESFFYSGPGVALSIGGDNYCYGHAYNLYLAGMNKYLHKRKLKTVLWGCSIEPSQVTSAMAKDFSRYDLIAARETLSYECLKKYNSNTVLICDPAFWLEKEKVLLPVEFLKDRTIGINISPLIIKREKIPGITMQNYKNLIEYILSYTNYQIALIPHVVCEANDDRIILRELYSNFRNSERIVFIDDCNCEKLKGYISQCKMFIGARTHATIAAYSTGVPTLVIGYSTKATGIAKDLFGTSEKYVLQVQKLVKSDDMIKSFNWLNENKESIHAHLVCTMPEYKNRIYNGIKALEEL